MSSVAPDAADSPGTFCIDAAIELRRELGADVIVTGLSPETAQTLVNIGVDLGKMKPWEICREVSK